MDGTLHQCPALRGRQQVFADRADAGRVLAGLLQGQEHAEESPVLFAVPAGGVPVAVVMAQRLGWPLEVAVVSKLTLPWNSEAGYGAVAFDGSVLLNEPLVEHYRLSAPAVEAGIAATRDKVARRSARFRGQRPWPELARRPAILVDDGIASGFTLRAAVAALRKAGADRIAIAAPTGHARAITELLHHVEALYCANVRQELPFAVASAYRQWNDVSEDEALALFTASRTTGPAPG